MGEHRKAIDVFEGISEKHKDNVNITYALARSRAALTEYDTAIPLLKRLSPRAPRSYGPGRAKKRYSRRCTTTRSSEES